MLHLRNYDEGKEHLQTHHLYVCPENSEELKIHLLFRDYLRTHQDVREKYGVTPSEFIDMKALMGDSSDNIPGVPGIGEKTASRIISAWHSIEEAYAHADEIKPKKASQNLKENYEKAQFSKVLVTIRTDCPLEFDPEAARIGDFLNEESYQIMKQLELNQIISRFDQIPGGEAGRGSALTVIEKEDLLNNLIENCTEEDILGMYGVCENGFCGLVIAGLKDHAKNSRADGQADRTTGQAEEAKGEKERAQDRLS